METQIVQATQANKLLSIGRAWKNDRQNESGTSPAITIRVDNTLGINVLIGKGSELVLYPNDQKRTGLNPNTQAEYRDADYRLAMRLPADVVDREIERQRVASEQRKATAQVTPAPTAPMHAQPVTAPMPMGA